MPGFMLDGRRASCAWSGTTGAGFLTPKGSGLTGPAAKSRFSTATALAPQNFARFNSQVGAWRTWASRWSVLPDRSNSRRRGASPHLHSSDAERPHGCLAEPGNKNN